MMEKQLDVIFNALETTIDKTVLQVDKRLEALSQIPRKILVTYNDLLTNIDDEVYDRLNKNTYAGYVMRRASTPWNHVILYGYKYLFANAYGRSLIFVPGVHMVRASVGGGKSLLSYILADMYLEQFGLGSYFTSPVEKPRTSEDGRFDYVFHRYVDLGTYFSNGKKIKKFNTSKHKVIHKDERQVEFNPRQSTTKEYKDNFLPQQRDEILMRHQGITHIYKYTQYTKLDSQDMQALTYMHDVQTIKDIPYKQWIEKGTFDYVPIKLKITTYILDISFDGTIKRKRVGSCKIPVTQEQLDHFDTHAERYRDAGLKLDFE